MQKKILVIDDDLAILDCLSLILEESGYAVSTLSRGEQALGEIEQPQPQLILLDLLMSGSDGRTICKEVKNRKDLNHIPVVMISAHPSAYKGAVESGADGFLAKPFELDDLCQTIESVGEKTAGRAGCSPL